MRRLIRAALCAPIVAYRWLISPVLGCHCRFHPSCSAYALEALRHRPMLLALRLILARLARCHPWHPGGYDPLPAEGDGDHARAVRRDAPRLPTSRQG